MARDDSAAYAVNWWKILLLDAVVALTGVVAGLAFVGRGRSVLGSLLVGAGLAYLVLGGRRLLRWKRLRAEGPPA